MEYSNGQRSMQPCVPVSSPSRARFDSVPVQPSHSRLDLRLWSFRRRVGGCQDVDDDPYHSKQTKRHQLSDQYAIQKEEN